MFDHVFFSVSEEIRIALAIFLQELYDPPKKVSMLVVYYLKTSLLLCPKKVIDLLSPVKEH